MNLTLRQLRAFVLLAEAGNFTVAAQHMHITQSALSALIKELEQGVGLRLFDRHTRMVALTAAGANFRPVAEKMLADLEHAVRELHDLASLRRGRVRIVASTVIAAGLLSPAFEVFRRSHPEIQFVLRDVAEEQIIATVKSGAVDFGIATSGGESQSLNETPLFDDRFIALFPTGHPLARKSRIAWRELQEQPFIALAPESPIRKLIDTAVAKAGLRLDVVNEVSFATTVLSLVGAGMGVSVLPVNNHPYLPAFKVHAAELIDPLVTRKISIFTPAHRSLPPAAEAFMAFLQTRVATMQPNRRARAAR